MKTKTNDTMRLLIAGASCVLLLCHVPVCAQQLVVPELVPLPKPTAKTEVIKLHNTEAAAIASMLDSEKYPLAQEANAPCAQPYPWPISKAISPYPTSGFYVPAGIESWKPLADQNAIEASGTEDALMRLRKRIEFLDVIQRRVQVETALYTVFAETRAQIAPPPVDKGTKNLKQAFEVVYMRRKQQDLLAEAVKAGHAQMLDNQKRSGFSNSPLCFNSTLKTEDPVLSRSITALITPTVNGDGTITVLMRPQFQQITITPAGNRKASQVVDTVCIVQDGDTVALLVPADEAKQGWIYLLTPRILPFEKPPATTDK